VKFSRIISFVFAFNFVIWDVFAIWLGKFAEEGRGFFGNVAAAFLF